jgi:hypothetical protein
MVFNSHDNGTAYEKNQLKTQKLIFLFSGNNKNTSKIVFYCVELLKLTCKAIKMKNGTAYE